MPTADEYGVESDEEAWRIAKEYKELKDNGEIDPDGSLNNKFYEGKNKK